MNKSILLIQSENSQERKILLNSGYSIVQSVDSVEIFEYVHAKNRFDLIIIDTDSKNVAETLLMIRKISSITITPLFFLFSKENEQKLQKISDIPAYGYWDKNTSGFLLLKTIEIAFTLSSLKKNKTLLLKNENRYRKLFETSSDAILILNKFKFINCNESTVKMFGYSEKKEILNKNFWEMSPITQPDGKISQQKAEALIYEVLFDRQQKFYWKFSNQNGAPIDTEVSLTLLYTNDETFIQAIIHDISEKNKTALEIKFANIQLTESLEEKGLLIKELYHRTKNTMQLIIGMLSLQSATYPDNTGVQSVVKSTEQRIHAIALVHQMLFQNKTLSHISIEDYIRDLSTHVYQKLSNSKCYVTFKYELEENLFLLEMAIPFGIVLNELLTNSFRHAFIKRDKGCISISIKNDGLGNILFQYSDDGQGTEKGFNFSKQKSLGLTLIYSLAENQLSADVSMKNENGVICNIFIPVTNYTDRL